MFQSPPSRPNSDQSTLEIPIRFVPNFGCKELPSSIMFHPSSHSVTKWGGQTSGSNQPKKTTRRMIYIYINRYRYCGSYPWLPGCRIITQEGHSWHSCPSLNKGTFSHQQSHYLWWGRLDYALGWVDDLWRKTKLRGLCLESKLQKNRQHKSIRLWRSNPSSIQKGNQTGKSTI